jgi:hypothetical protein
MEGLEINLINDETWLVDMLNRSMTLKKVIVRLLVKSDGELDMGKEEAEACVYKLFSPLKNLRNAEIVVKIEKLRSVLISSCLSGVS